MLKAELGWVRAQTNHSTVSQVRELLFKFRVSNNRSNKIDSKINTQNLLGDKKLTERLNNKLETLILFVIRLIWRNSAEIYRGWKFKQIKIDTTFIIFILMNSNIVQIQSPFKQLISKTWGEEPNDSSFCSNFSSQVFEDRRKKKIVSKSKKQRKQRTYSRWKRTDDLIYMNFLKTNETIFSNENLRRVKKVFSLLSKEMNYSKTPNQCRSHHQKMRMITKNGSNEQIINYLQSKYLSTKERAVYSQGADKETVGVACKQYEGYTQQCLDGIAGKFIKITIFTDYLQRW